MTLDLALLKNVRLQGSTSLQFRAEIFNLTNRPNFGQPSVNVFSQSPNGGGTINPDDIRKASGVSSRRHRTPSRAASIIA